MTLHTHILQYISRSPRIPGRSVSRAARTPKAGASQRIVAFTSTGMLAALYGGVGFLVLQLSDAYTNTAAIWPAHGIAIAALLVFGKHLWPGVFIGAFLAQWASTTIFLSSLGIAVGNTIGALLAVYLASRFADGIYAFRTAQNTIRYVVLAGLFAAGVTATLNTLALIPVGVVETLLDAEIRGVRIWFAHMGGAVLFAPLLILLLTDRKFLQNRRYIVEATLMALLAVVLAIGHASSEPLMQAASIVLIVPLLLTAAARLLVRDMMIVLFLYETIVVFGIAGGILFPETLVDTSLLLLQVLVNILTITGLYLSSLITERRDLSARKDLFIGIASHELKTPVSALRLMLETMERTVQPKPDSDLHEQMRDMSDQIDAVTRTVDDLLDLSRVQAGRLTLEPEHFSLHQLLERVAKTCTMVHPNHHIRVINEAGQDAIVYADRQRIRRIIVNLIGNAVKYSPDAEYVDITLKQHSDQFSISVRDYGIGIKPGDQERIFGKHFRADEISDHYPGLGIGLYVAAQIIAKHGGTISAERNAPEKGSTFTLTMPDAVSH